MRDEFVVPDWNAPLDVDARVRAVPAHGRVKGLFLQSVVERTRAVSGRVPREHEFIASREYPIGDLVELLAQCTTLAYPEVPPREGLRRLGRAAYESFATSGIGRAVLGAARGQVKDLLKLAPKAWSLSGNLARAEVKEVEAPGAAGGQGGGSGSGGAMIVQLRDMWDWPDCYGVGMLEAVLDSSHVSGKVTVRPLSMCNADLRVVWR